MNRLNPKRRSPIPCPDVYCRTLSSWKATSPGRSRSWLQSTQSENALRVGQAAEARFGLASTNEVYGDPTDHPHPEPYWRNVNSIGARSVYDEAKQYGRGSHNGLRPALMRNVGIIRVFNTYGPRPRPHNGRVISTFIGQALRVTRLPFTLFDSAEALTCSELGRNTRLQTQVCVSELMLWTNHEHRWALPDSPIPCLLKAVTERIQPVQISSSGPDNASAIRLALH